ncbi:uncharacterized protein LOC131221153 [Magnolia sinica]|uniref:uncharacterized protein LOC131221153 n=1 Tax=Magnolia sinica TaxID=86752 RepID=UPI002659202A|nr:uncharacterized protein LOC131221153 [Magnolia sinica]
MEQLLNMGFSHELATRALEVTGGKSTVKATEWILNQKSTPTPSSPSSPSPIQPRLDRYFFNPKPHPNQISTVDLTPSDTTHRPSPETSLPPSKRPKLHPLPTPLSERARPRSIDDIVGQDHLLSIIRSALSCDRLPSIVLWGPPGTGKTSIARAISNSAPASYRFVSISAVTAGVKDVRDAVDEARRAKKQGVKTVLFVDEVHRFNKSQQDSFLPVIEDGSVVFMGATTENPSFHLITPLLSRCRVLSLNKLQPHHIVKLLERAAADAERGLARSVRCSSISVEEDAVNFLSLHCDGDARVALNALEIAATSAAARMPSGSDENGVGLMSAATAIVSVDDAKEAMQCKHLAYDRAGEEHYNLISALHKSMRGSDADAAIYWLARMLEGGEEPLYIARRLIRFASEDVGLADPAALGHAVACYQACHFLGMPECNVNLAQCVAYLALAPKSVAVYRAIEAAQRAVKESIGQNEGVPLHLRNAPTKLMKEIGYGKGYIYPPDHPSSSSSQKYLPPSLQGHKFLDWPPSALHDENLSFPFSQQGLS